MYRRGSVPLPGAVRDLIASPFDLLRRLMVGQPPVAQFPEKGEQPLVARFGDPRFAGPVERRLPGGPVSLGMRPGTGDGFIQPLALFQPVVFGVETVEPFTGRDALQQIWWQETTFGADRGEEVGARWHPSLLREEYVHTAAPPTGMKTYNPSTSAGCDARTR